MQDVRRTPLEEKPVQVKAAHEHTPTEQAAHDEVQRRRERVQQQVAEHEGDPRFARELAELKDEKDLREIDDDVEAATTFLEWTAPEHIHQPKSKSWYMILAVITTVIVGALLLIRNWFGAVTIALGGGFLYFFAQREPEDKRYRLMADGVAINETLYHYRDLEAFNIVYEPGDAKIVLLRSKRKLTPLITIELGDIDPVTVREVLIDFVDEDEELEEPLTDIYARRLGF